MERKYLGQRKNVMIKNSYFSSGPLSVFLSECYNDSEGQGAGDENTIQYLWRLDNSMNTFEILNLLQTLTL